MVESWYDESGRGARPRRPRRVGFTGLRRAVRALVLVLMLGPFVGLVGGSGLAGAAVGTPDDPEVTGVWPLVPVPTVVNGFDPPDQPWEPGHRGVDLLGSPGQQVRSALPGEVTFAGRIAGRGVVVVSHGETRTTYEPVTSSVPVGTSVGAGSAIGHLQLPGSHCFPRACLHWGWLRGETYLNPLLLVGVRPVRLLPLYADEPARPGSEDARAATSSAATVAATWRALVDLLGLV